MNIKYRLVKNSPLTAEEMDNNFHEVEKAVDEIAKRYKELESDFAKIDKGDFASAWRVRGEWKKDAEYEKDDLVYFACGIFLCKKLHKSQSDILENESDWLVVADFASEVKSEIKKMISEICVNRLPEKGDVQQMPEQSEIGKIIISSDGKCAIWNGIKWKEF